MGFNREGAPLSLLPPANSNQHYVLEWAGADEIKWKSIEKVEKESITKSGKVLRVYVDPDTNQLVYVEEDA